MAFSPFYISAGQKSNAASDMPLHLLDFVFFRDVIFSLLEKFLGFVAELRHYKNVPRGIQKDPIIRRDGGLSVVEF